MPKLTILVHEKMGAGQKISQAVHAAVAYEQKHGDWSNDTVVVLDAPRALIVEASAHEHSVPYLDEYYDWPRAVAFTKPPGGLELASLKLAR